MVHSLFVHHETFKTWVKMAQLPQEHTFKTQMHHNHQLDANDSNFIKLLDAQTVLEKHTFFELSPPDTPF